MVAQPVPLQLQEANAQLAEQAGPQDVEVTPVQRRIEPRSADDSLSGVVRCLYFADTFLRDGENGRSGHPGAVCPWSSGKWVIGWTHGFWKAGKHCVPTECQPVLAPGCPGPQQLLE